MGLVKDTLDGLANLFDKFKFTDGVVIIVLFLLLMSIMQGFTDRDLFQGIPVLGQVMDALGALMPSLPDL